MNEHEEYFRISKQGSVHILNDRIPFKPKEFLIFTTTSLLFLIWFLGVGIGIYVAILTTIAYILYRFASWIYYSELKIDEKDKAMVRTKHILNRIHKTELITKNFDPTVLEYIPLTRSGKTKYLMNYRSHKSNALLIIRTEQDKKLIENYIAENVKLN